MNLLSLPGATGPSSTKTSFQSGNQTITPSPSRIVEPSVVGKWNLSRHSLTPSLTCMQNLSEVLATCDDDLLVTFRFPSYKSEKVRTFVHRSRLDFVGGKLSDTVSDGFSFEKRDIITLTDADSPATFHYVRKFLYFQVIDFAELNMDGLLRLVSASCRWELRDLFYAVLLYVEKYDLLSIPQTLLDFAVVLSMEDTPVGFKKYFCNQLCSRIDGALSILSAIEESSDKASNVPTSALSDVALFWETLFRTNLLSFVFNRLTKMAKMKHQAFLVHSVMVHLEPIVEDDTKFIQILLQLAWNQPSCGKVMSASDKWIRKWSLRAHYLGIRAMRFPVISGASLTIPLCLRAQDMRNGGLKTVYSKPYSIASTLFYISCSREIPLVEATHAGGGGTHSYYGISLYVHIELEAVKVNRHGFERKFLRTTSKAEKLDQEGEAYVGMPSSLDTSDCTEIGSSTDFSNVKAWVQLKNDGCKCGPPAHAEENWHGFFKEESMEFTLEDLGKGGVQLGWQCLLAEKDVEDWISLHEDHCCLTATTVITLDSIP